MFGKVVGIRNVLRSLPRMGSKFGYLVEAIPGFVKVSPKRGVEKFEVLVSGHVSILWIPLRVGLRFYLRNWLVTRPGCEGPLEWNRTFGGLVRSQIIVLKRTFWNRGWEIREYVCKILTYLVVCTEKFMD